jgi:hypothetical protein
MDRLKLESILGNYTNECIEDLLNIFNNKKGVKKSDIFLYLRKKYKITGCPSRGQKNYWILRGYSEKDASIKIKEFSHVYSTFTLESIMNRHGVDENEAKNIIEKRIIKMKKTYENMSEEKLSEINKKKASNSLENCIRKYGENAGKKIYYERIEKLKDNVSLSGYIKRYGSVEGTKMYNEFCESVKSQNTLAGYIERYGDEIGIKKYNETQSKKSFSNTLAGYIKRYGDEIGVVKYNERQNKYLNSLYINKSQEEIVKFNKSKGLTYNNAILKYGIDKANEIFNSRHIKASHASKESLKVLIPFYKYLRKASICKTDIFWGISGSNEYFIRENEKFVIFDFTIRSKRIIIEFNGTTWHSKTQDSNWKSPYGTSAKDSYEYDKQKREIAQRQGFKVITIWSDETPQKNLQKLIEQYEYTTHDIL